MVREHAFAGIEQSIVIEQPIEDVFAFYRDFRNLPRFLGDVILVEITGEQTSRWTIKAPLGLDLHWNIIVTDMRPNAFIAYETDSITARTHWELNFLQGIAPRTTIVHETLSLPGSPIVEVALAAFGKPPALEVRANLRRLKEVLETGHVTTMDFAVAGKFAH